jgi:hypothetical protein
LIARVDQGPFGSRAPGRLEPGVVLMEDAGGYWRTDLFALLAQHGYTVFARSRQNVALRRG